MSTSVLSKAPYMTSLFLPQKPRKTVFTLQHYLLKVWLSTQALRIECFWYTFLFFLNIVLFVGGWHVNARLVWVSCTSTCCYQVSHVSIAPCEQCVTCLKTNIMNLHCYSELYLTNKYMYLNMDFHNKIWMVHTIKNINHKFQNADIITDLEVTKLEPLLYTCWHT